MHKQLGDYSNAIHNFERAAQTAMERLDEVKATGASLPVNPHTAAQRKAFDKFATAIADMQLSSRYASNVVPAVKGN